VKKVLQTKKRTLEEAGFDFSLEEETPSKRRLNNKAEVEECAIAVNEYLASVEYLTFLKQKMGLDT